ncbi:FecR family protein [Sphingomonas sp. BK235]|nr:FecR family protein [Sphingomonas sp. BK235]
MAAALALISVPGGVLIIARSSLWSDLSGGRTSLTSRYETQRGERATASLSDGTVVSLNSDTALEVTFDQAGRHVQLCRGQALFEVAKDKHRPFVVRAGNSAVTALGTVFDVKMAKEAFRVVLVEGRVAVNAEADPRSAAVILTQGQELLKNRVGDIRVQTTDAEAALLWRKGLVEFNDVTLANAVEQINETSARSLRLTDSRIGALRLSGIYRTGSPERFVASIAQVLPVSGRGTSEGIVIEPREKKSE